MAYQQRATRTPQTPAQQLASAITRVQKGLQEGKDYRVCAHGKRFDTGETFFCVPSESEKLRGLWHVVTVKAAGLDCDCFYSREKQQVCSHRAVVYLFLQAKAKAAKAANASQTRQEAHQTASPAPTATQPTQASNVQRNAATALYGDDTYKGSIYKPERDPSIEQQKVAMRTKGAQARVTEEW